MIRFRFSLRQALLGVACAAVLLVLVRFALRTRSGTAVAITISATIAVVAAANVLIYAILRIVGPLAASDADATQPSPESACESSAPAASHNEAKPS